MGRGYRPSPATRFPARASSRVAFSSRKTVLRVVSAAVSSASRAGGRGSARGRPTLGRSAVSAVLARGWRAGRGGCRGSGRRGSGRAAAEPPPDLGGCWPRPSGVAAWAARPQRAGHAHDRRPGVAASASTIFRSASPSKPRYALVNGSPVKPFLEASPGEHADQPTISGRPWTSAAGDVELRPVEPPAWRGRGRRGRRTTRAAPVLRLDVVTIDSKVGVAAARRRCRGRGGGEHAAADGLDAVRRAAIAARHALHGGFFRTARSGGSTRGSRCSALGDPGMPAETQPVRSAGRSTARAGTTSAVDVAPAWRSAALHVRGWRRWWRCRSDRGHRPFPPAHVGRRIEEGAATFEGAVLRPARSRRSMPWRGARSAAARRRRARAARRGVGRWPRPRGARPCCSSPRRGARVSGTGTTTSCAGERPGLGAGGIFEAVKEVGMSPYRGRQRLGDRPQQQAKATTGRGLGGDRLRRIGAATARWPCGRR